MLSFMSRAALPGTSLQRTVEPLVLSEGPTQARPWNPRRKKSSEAGVTLVLPEREQFKYLGLLLDKDCSWAQ
jgi:hypothetical protein